MGDFSVFETIYDEFFEPVCFSDALRVADIPNVDSWIPFSTGLVQGFRRTKRVPEGAEFIVAFVQRQGWQVADEATPFTALNNAIFSLDEDQLYYVRYLLYGLLKSLRCLPLVQFGTLFRGCSFDVKWPRGSVQVWCSFTPMTLSQERAIKFAQSNPGVKGTVVCAVGMYGYDVSDFAPRDDKTVLLEPYTAVTVTRYWNDCNPETVEVEYNPNACTCLLGDRIPQPPHISCAIFDPIHQGLEHLNERRKKTNPDERNIEISLAISSFEKVKKDSTIGGINYALCNFLYSNYESEKREGLETLLTCGISDEDISYMSFLCCDTFIEYKDFNLIGRGINNKQAAEIVQFFRVALSMNKLVLSKNLIGPSDPSSFGLFCGRLRNCYSITCLELDENPIGNEGFGLLVDSLLNNANLRELSLSSIGINHKVAPFLSKLMGLSSIEKLFLSRNAIGDDGVSSIFQGLHHNSTITELGLGSTSCTNACFSFLEGAMRTNRTLRRLDVHSNAISPEGAEIIKNCLKTRSINYLNISGTNIGNQGKEALRKAKEEWVGLYIEGVDS